MREALWKGRKQYLFSVNGRESFVVAPDRPLPGRPWAWRAEFFGAFDSADVSLLDKGWFLAYHKVSDMYGSPEAIASMRDFQSAAEKEFRLSGKTVLFGFSRGGLYAVNYAFTYPEKTAALYLDAPVLDIKSWPGGMGAGAGDAACWEECKKIYGLADNSAAGFKENPLDRAEALAKAGIPVIIVAGDADRAVPYSENGAIFKEKYEKAGGAIKVILKPGVGHHPHSLEDPRPITEFLERFI